MSYTAQDSAMFSHIKQVCFAYRKYFLRKHHSPILSDFQEEDIGRVQHAVTRSELDMEAHNALTTSYTAAEDTENRSRLDSNQLL